VKRTFWVYLLVLGLILSWTLVYAGDFYVIPIRKGVIRPPKTINVPSDVSTIKEAVDEAVEGDTIKIAAGTYNETVSISKNGLTIEGGGKDNTVISGDSSAIVITVNSIKQCKINDITIQGGSLGVYCSFGEVTFSNCRVQNNPGFAGILARHNSSVSLGNTDVNGNQYGVWVDRSASIAIEDCNIFSNSQNGVSIWYTSSASIKGCDIYSNGGNGIQVGGGSSIKLSLSKVHGNTYSGIDVTQLSTIALRGGNDIYSNADNSGWRAGIGAYHSSNVVATLSDTTDKDEIYLNNGPGIYISNNSSLFMASGKTYQNKGDGIHLHLNSTTQLEDVSVTNNSGYGIACNDQSVLTKTASTIIANNTLGDTDDCW